MRGSRASPGGGEDPLVSFRFFLRLVRAALGGSWFQAPDHTADSLATVYRNVKNRRAILVDVRERSEWEKFHVPGARLIPLSDILDDPLSLLDQSDIPSHQIIYLHCQAGGRSRMAAYQLRDSGYELRPLKAGPQTIAEAFRRAESDGTDSE